MKKKLFFILFNVAVFHTFSYSQNNMNIDPNMQPRYVQDVYTPSPGVNLPAKSQAMIDAENQLNEIQSRNQKLLEEQKLQEENGNQGFDVEKAVHETFDNINSNQSFGSQNQPVDISSSSTTNNSESGTQSVVDNNIRNIDRYQNSPCYQALGFNPSDPNLEQKYLACESQKRNSDMLGYVKFLVPIIIVLVLVFYTFSFFNKKNKTAYKTVPLDYYTTKKYTSLKNTKTNQNNSGTNKAASSRTKKR